MARQWYLVPGTDTRKPEIGEYEVSGSLTDFPRGVYMAYADKGLVTGLSSRREAERWRDEGKYDPKTDRWTVIPAREAE